MKFKIKYQDGATKKYGMWVASLERKKFSQLLHSGKLAISTNNKKAEFDIISFSGKRDLEEQVLSICSFLHYVGVPQQWIIYSDGSHDERDKEAAQKHFPFLKFKNWNDNHISSNHPLIQEYLKTCHLSKKLGAILGHQYERQTIYLDSDIVFYNNAGAYLRSEILQQGFWYAPDTNWGTMKENISDMFALNSGLLILNKNFNFEYVFEYLKELNDKFEYFSEQNSFNYSFKKQQAKVLDPRQFIISTEDQFNFGMGFESGNMAMRHYVTPVRHKMWQKGWKWHFTN